MNTNNSKSCWQDGISYLSEHRDRQTRSTSRFSGFRQVELPGSKLKDNRCTAWFLTGRNHLAQSRMATRLSSALQLPSRCNSGRARAERVNLILNSTFLARFGRPLGEQDTR